MKIYNNYVIAVASLLLLTTVVLATIEVNSLDVYYTCYVVEALIVTELYVYFNSRARRSLTIVSAVLFAGFMVIILSAALRVLT
jgi:ABC-type cobalamin transport system permease subunit